MLNLNSIPKLPGVYIFKDKDDNILYIGKAKNLKKRVNSYFQNNLKSIKTLKLSSQIENIEYLVTHSEKEALILEANLIKKYKPRYNIYFRDDKQYIYLIINNETEYPYLKLTRKKNNFNEIYGPYTSANLARDTLRVINRYFKLRKCGGNLKKRKRPCLQYHINRCFAPCFFEISKSLYLSELNKVRLFLKGKKEELVSCLKSEMFSYSEKLNFEKAAEIRDKLIAIEKTLEQQYVEFKEDNSLDVIDFYMDDWLIKMSVLCVREGKVFDNFVYSFENIYFEDKEDIFLKIIIQFYLTKDYIPDKIVTSLNIKNNDLSAFFSEFFKKNIIIVNNRRKYAKLLELARLNLINKENSDSEDFIFLRDNNIYSIEVLDVSHFYGQDTFLGLVRFEKGRLAKDKYRLYKFENLNNDILVFKEFLKRRIGNNDLPDLFLIDGGKTHLKNFVQELKKYGLQNIKVIAIAKGDKRSKNYLEDKIYFSSAKMKLELAPGDKFSLFIQKLRDEAHRFVLQAQKRARSRRYTKDLLSEIKGIGPKTARLIWQKFNTLERIKKASVEELSHIEGIGLKKARIIKKELEKL